MTQLIMFCIDCKKILDENSDNHCEAITSEVEGYKGGLHWYQAFYADEIPEDPKYDFVREYAKKHAKSVQQSLF
jgi:hypothetical protein